MKKIGFEYIGQADDFKMPDWMDCTWRRKACGKDKCKICGKINKNRQTHIMAGQDPDSMESVLEDVGKNFKEALEMIRKDAEARGIDLDNINDFQEEEPPEPEEFELCRELSKWQSAIHKLAEKAEDSGYKWLETEAATDLLWYKNTLLVKTYRQLCNRWHLDRGDEYGEFDFKYTNHVLKECLDILKKSLARLISAASNRRGEWMILLARLNDLENDILNI